jgi:hypothetical protein
MSTEARLAGKIQKRQGIFASRRVSCSVDRKRACFDWPAQALGGLRGCHRWLEAVFDATHARGAEVSLVKSG